MNRPEIKEPVFSKRDPDNLLSDLKLIKSYYYSTIPDKNSMEGLSFGRYEWSPLVVIFMNNFFDTAKYWLEATYPQHVKVYDYRKESFGVGAHNRFFTPDEDYYKKVEEQGKIKSIRPTYM